MRRAALPLSIRFLLVALLAVSTGSSLSRPIIASPLLPTPVPAVQQGAPATASITRSRQVAVTLEGMPTPENGAGLMAGARGPIRLDLFDDVSVTLEFERFEPNTRSTTWVGRVAGQPTSHVTLVYGDGLMTGSVVTGDRTYTIRPATPDTGRAGVTATGVLHVVNEVNQGAFRREAEPVDPSAMGARRSQRDVAADGGGYLDPADIIDLLVVYTPEAVLYGGGTAGIHDLIMLGVAETNTSYAASGVTQRLRLAHMAEVPHVEHPDSLQTLNDLRSGMGGFVDVAGLRNTWAADIVMLVQLSSSSSCGIAFLMTTPGVTFEDSAFSVVEADCISPNYTFAHELGHNMGLRHDWYVDDETTPYAHGHGHVSIAGSNRWRTVMSYGDLCAATGEGCPRLLAWSNPDVLYNGLPMGVPIGTSTSCTVGSLDANTCDASDYQVLNTTAIHVANFRHAIPGPFATTSPTADQVLHPGSRLLAWTESFRATGYEYCVDTIANDTCDTSWVAVGDATNTLVLDLAPATRHFWQVRATNVAGEVQASAGTWSSFTTGPAPEVNFARNGSFTWGLNHWLQYATPDSSHIVAQTTSERLEFYRLPAGPGVPNQAVVFQQTNTALVAGAAVELSFNLGNSDSVRKRISVVVHDADFSDLAVCTFWLPPHTPLATYGMRTYTTESWSNATLSFYAASAGSQGGFYQIDDVSIEYAPGVSANRTDCVDPGTPEPEAAADSAELIVNGGFAADTLAPWNTYGTITHEIVSGVMRFVRPTGAAPSGVLLQATGVAANEGDVLTASFQLGNNSNVRKRVTAILHDNNFSDLSACTFWLPPGQPLSSYVYRSYTTKPWTNITLSLYPATVGTEEWILFDNATLRMTPGATIVGTECLEPVTGPDALAGGSDDEASVPAESTNRTATDTAPAVVEGTWRSDGFVWSSDGTTWSTALPDGGARHTLEWDTLLERPDGRTVHLVFDSWLDGAETQASVEVSVDGVAWLTVREVEPSSTWTPVVVDLEPHTGHHLYVRFVLDGVTATAREGRWQLRDIRVVDGG